MNIVGKPTMLKTNTLFIPLLWRTCVAFFVVILALMVLHSGLLTLGIDMLRVNTATFVKLKPTFAYLSFAIVILISEFWLGINVIRMVAERGLNLSRSAWRNYLIELSDLYIAFAVLNVLVAFTASVDTWVNYKLFSGFPFLIGIYVVTNRISKLAALDHGSLLDNQNDHTYLPPKKIVGWGWRVWTYSKKIDVLFLRVWTYLILPLPILIFFYSFLTQNNFGGLFMLVIFGGLAFGLHKKSKFAWYANWFFIIALASIPQKFIVKEYGAIGGMLGFLWGVWLLMTWYRLKQFFITRTFTVIRENMPNEPGRLG